MYRCIFDMCTILVLQTRCVGGHRAWLKKEQQQFFVWILLRSEYSNGSWTQCLQRGLKRKIPLELNQRCWVARALNLPSVGYLQPSYMPKRTWAEIYYRLDVTRIVIGAHIKTYLGTKTTLLCSMYENSYN